LYTPPALVIDEIRKAHAGKVSLLVFGTPVTVEIYKSLIVKLGLEYQLTVLPLESAEQDLVNQVIEAAISGDSALSDSIKKKIIDKIILPRQNVAGDLRVIEACTDIRLGLGINSLDVLITRSVTDVYGIDGSGI
jgi:aspartate/glutamate racemase